MIVINIFSNNYLLLNNGKMFRTFVLYIRVI